MARVIAVVLVGLGLVRSAFYLIYAACTVPLPLETYYLESKMVLLSYRAQAGLSLYPSWEDGPYVSNFFGPIYFLLAGWIGRFIGVDLRGLFLVGRGISVASGLLMAAVVGIWAGRRYGRGAGFAAAVVAIGSAPMVGFSVMSRPDLLADLLGLTGFALTGGRWRAARLSGMGLMVLAVFTKQTAGVYLVAAVLALWLEGRRGWAIGALLGGGGAILAIVAAVTLGPEPNFARSLVAESKTPWNLTGYVEVLKRLAWGGADLVVLPLIGLALWSRGPLRSPRLAALTVVVLAVGLATATKRGADMNYFLCLRGVESLGVAALWAADRTPGTRRRGLAFAAVTTLAAASLVPSTVIFDRLAETARGFSAVFASPPGRSFVASQLAMAYEVADPRSKILTDSGFLDIRRKDRAEFGDPWLFRMLVETGRLHPTGMIERVDSGYYDTVITTQDVFQPEYITQEFGLPMAVVDHLRGRYEFAGRQPSMFIYRRIGR